MLTNNHYLLNSQGSRFLIFSVPSLSGKSYTSYDEISAALVNGEVSGALIDTYVLGSRKDLFENPSLRLIKIYDYSTAYGVVLGGEAKKLTQCFRKYVQSNKEKIFQRRANYKTNFISLGKTGISPGCLSGFSHC